MKKLRIIVSLGTRTNDFQREQATVAEEVAKRLDVSAEILYAENDAVAQTEQLLNAIQAAPEKRPDAVVVQPTGGTPLPQVARAAAGAGVAWVLLNWTADYIGELRKTSKAIMFSFSSDQKEIGRLQARQYAALLPQGGTILYIQGPSATPAAQQRTQGMNESRPQNLLVKMLKSSSWTQEGGQTAVNSLLRLSTSQKERIDLIGAQNDLIAMGARKAFQEHGNEAERQKWLSLPFLGVDGLERGGCAWVNGKLLAATIVVPPSAGIALENVVNAIRTGAQPPELTLMAPTSFPALKELKPVEAS